MKQLTLLAALLLSTTACVPVFEFSSNEKLKFDQTPMTQQWTTTADLMCCYDCTV